MCSQTESTGSFRKFERTTVWTMVWRWSDHRSFWSEKSDHRRIRAQLGLIITSSSAFLCSQTESTGSGPKFECTIVWAMVWSWSDQRSIWSDKSDHRRIRAQLSLIINRSSAIGSDQKCFRTLLALIRDHLERLILFSFFWFFY